MYWGKELVFVRLQSEWVNVHSSIFSADSDGSKKVKELNYADSDDSESSTFW